MSLLMFLIGTSTERLQGLWLFSCVVPGCLFNMYRLLTDLSACRSLIYLELVKNTNLRFFLLLAMCFVKHCKANGMCY